MKIGLAADHAGFELKEDLKSFLKDEGLEVQDMGSYSPECTDYPDWGVKLARMISSQQLASGILICATGVGMSVVANKFPGVRAALVTDIEMARKSKEHNNSNVLVLASSLTTKTRARILVKEWMEAEFKGGQHSLRLEKINGLEKELYNNHKRSKE